jgi:hypothetical protein
MSNKVYKYFSPSVLDLVFARPGLCGIKCSLPKDFNDPFELFLGVDLTVTPELLAAYRELLAELPQRPTSCFSKSPIVSPMWAHYGDNHSGLVVEFDVDALTAAFPDIVTMDVTYRTEPSENIAGQLQRAAGTKKPRHAYFLQQTVLASAYFSKDVAWSYEQEWRLLDQEEYCETIAGNKILQVPIACCTAIIAGSKATPVTVARTQDIATQGGMRWLHAVIGKSIAQPFMETETDGVEMVPAAKVCQGCSEPIPSGKSHCAWCSITGDDALNAALGNPLRMLDHLGMLDDYYRGLEELARSRKPL